MKPKVIYSDKFLNSISWFMKIGGISLFPFIILRERYKGTMRGEQVINHESIHFQQQLELLVIPFYVLYVLNFIINIFTMNKSPYRNILFEKEAFYNESNLDYLKIRKRYNWINLIKK
jgi:hypothetical protein